MTENFSELNCSDMRRRSSGNLMSRGEDIRERFSKDHGMSSTEFRQHGSQMVDYIADYMTNIHNRRVVPSIEPGYLKELIPSSPPQSAEDFHKVLSDFESYIMPGVTHWQHPRFHATTVTGARFLLLDSRVLELEKQVFLIFASDRGLDLLRLYCDWSIDGTFFYSPENFVQLFTINVFRQESTLPAVFFLLPDKNEDTYQRAFNALFAHLEGVSPKTILSDFERAPLNVLETMFLNAIINYCLFHFAPSLFRNLSKKRLIMLYAIPGIKSLLRSFNAPAFLPEEEVETGFEELLVELSAKIAEQTIPHNSVAKLKEFLQYIEVTYIRRINEVGEESAPLFPIALWNCHNSVINNLPKTNNAIEGWHKEFNRKFSKRNLKLSHFIVRLKEEERATWQLALRHEANPADPIRNPRCVKVVNSQRQIFQLVTNYIALKPADRHRLTYLRSLQYHTAKIYSGEQMQEKEPHEEVIVQVIALWRMKKWINGKRILIFESFETKITLAFCLE